MPLHPEVQAATGIAIQLSARQADLSLPQGRVARGDMPAGTDDEDRGEGAGATKARTLTRGAESLSGAFKATVRHHARSSSYGFIDLWSIISMLVLCGAVAPLDKIW